MSTKRIGILTSGGDCPGLNAVIRGTVKACHQLGYDCVGFLKGYEGLHDPVQYVHLTPETTRGILNQGGTILGSTNKGRFAATVGVQDRVDLAPSLVTGVKQTIEQLGIDGLICVGGDGSLAVAQQLHENGIPVVGVPKTIDNDLSATAFTFGFDSAIECATDALDRLHTTAASHERIMVLEVMGRHAGWIALHAGIAGGGDVILIPEIGWNFEHVCHKILHRESQGKKFTLVVVAEGAELPGGGCIGEQQDGAQMKLGGLGRTVAEEIERRLHRETRLSVLGHLQRGGKPTTFDRVLATQFGAHAVRLVKEQRFGEMICSRPPEMTSVPIIEAVNVIRQVDPNGPAVQAARALGISFGDRPADEIGQDVFDRLEPVSHFAGFADASHHTPLIIDETATGEEAAEPTAVVEPAALALEERFEEVVEETAAEPTDSGATVAESATDEVVEQQTVAETTEAEIAEVTTPEETSSDEDVAVEEVVETVLDMAAEADEAAHGDGALGVEEPAAAPAETPSDAEPVEQREPEMPETDEAAADEQAVVEEAATEADAEEQPAAEEVVEEWADTDDQEVASDATPASNEEVVEEWADEPEEAAAASEAAAESDDAESESTPEAADAAPEEEVAEEWADEQAEVASDASEAPAAEAEPTEEEPAAAEVATEADDVEQPAAVAEDAAETTPEVAVEGDATSEESNVQETVLIKPNAEEAAAPDEADTPEPAQEEKALSEVETKLAQAQSQLAAEIAGAAKASRDDVAEDVTLELDSGQVDVLDLVEQKLAAASAEVAAASEAEPARSEEASDPPAEEAAAPAAEEPAPAAAEAKTQAKEESLAEPADKPHEDELIAEARLALEAALSE